jgi:hypothetical protein
MASAHTMLPTLSTPWNLSFPASGNAPSMEGHCTAQKHLPRLCADASSSSSSIYYQGTCRIDPHVCIQHCTSAQLRLDAQNERSTQDQLCAADKSAVKLVLVINVWNLGPRSSSCFEWKELLRVSTASSTHGTSRCHVESRRLHSAPRFEVCGHNSPLGFCNAVIGHSLARIANLVAAYLMRPSPPARCHMQAFAERCSSCSTSLDWKRTDWLCPLCAGDIHSRYHPSQLVVSD